MSPPTRPLPSECLTILRVTSGNFLEMFDFFLYGFYATAIASAFFPAGTPYISIMMTFATFGAGFLMRPLGALVLGSYVDRHGPRKGLVMTLAIMASGTVLIAFMPGYGTLGFWAPALVLVGRLLQGFSAGAELGGVSVYLSEIAPPGRKGFYVSWQSASQQVAIMFSAALGYFIHRGLPAAAIQDWGWRLPFFIGSLIIPVIFMIRRSLQDTPAFLSRPQHPTFRQMAASIVRHGPKVGTGVLMMIMTTVSFYLITVYTPTFAKNAFNLDPEQSLTVAFAVGLSNFLWLPLMGALSDRVGREPILILFALLTLLTAYPALSWLAAHPSFGHMLGVELWLSFLYASYNGASIVTLTEMMPPHVRTAGFSLAYSLATAVFGGFTPMVCTWLIEQTGDLAAPGAWMAFGAGCGLLATLLLRRHRMKTREGSATI